jgi:hypothetical protein
MAEAENGIGRFAGRSDSLGEESRGLRARIVEPALAALSLWDGMDVSLMVDLDLCFFVKGFGAKFVPVVFEDGGFMNVAVKERHTHVLKKI